jgi:hypothetical protein
MNTLDAKETPSIAPETIACVSRGYVTSDGQSVSFVAKESGSRALVAARGSSA